MNKKKPKLLVSLVAVMLCMAAFSMTAFASGDDWCEYGDYSAADSGTVVQMPASTTTPTTETAATTVTTEPAATTKPAATTEAVTATSSSSTTDTAAASASTDSTTANKSASGTALTPSGNLNLVDDMVQTSATSEDEASADTAATLEEKQFITVQSKNGNYFYLIIDRSDDKENVHFLNQVDESDLLSLIEDEDSDAAPVVCTCTDKCVVGAINTACPVCQTTMSECLGKEPEAEVEDEPETEPEQEESKSTGKFALAIVLVLGLAGGAAAYFLKFKKEKPDTKGPVDLDDYDFGDDDEDDEDYEFEPDDDEPEELNEGD
jgi:hypothetical protein